MTPEQARALREALARINEGRSFTVSIEEEPGAPYVTVVTTCDVCGSEIARHRFNVDRTSKHDLAGAQGRADAERAVAHIAAHVAAAAADAQGELPLW